MGTMIATIRDSAGNWVQYNQISNAKNDKVWAVQDLSGYIYYAYVDGDTDTLLKVFQCDEDGNVQNGANISISSGSGDRIFLNLNRDQSVLYVGASGETSIAKFNTSDMSSGTAITSPDNPVQNMRIDKEGILTVISHNGAATEVDRYDTKDSDNQLSNSIQLSASLNYTTMYFTIENYIVAGGGSIGEIRCFSLSGTTYSNEGFINTIAIGADDLTIDIYNNVVWLDTSGTKMYKAKIVGESGGTLYNSGTDITDPCYGISTDSNGNYYFSTWSSTGIQKLHKYADDNDAASFTSANFSVLRRNIATQCYNVDIIGYDVSGDGCAGR